MSFILDLLFPVVCCHCRCPGAYLCLRCRRRLKKLHLFPPRPGDLFDGRLSLFKYRPPIKNLLLDLKYRFVTDLVPELASLAAEEIITNYPGLLQHWQQHRFSLVPVPLHPRRHLWRGFNQSDLLAQALASRLSLPISPLQLRRRYYTAPQVSITDKALRFRRLADAFAAGPSSEIPGNYILFDDVATTGSTLNAAAAALKNINASSLWALTLAA